MISRRYPAHGRHRRPGRPALSNAPTPHSAFDWKQPKGTTLRSPIRKAPFADGLQGRQKAFEGA